MKPITLFSLDVHRGPYEEWPQETRLFANGEDTGQCVPGYVIEAQYRCAVGYLLITSYDCPFEESNDFLLLNGAFEVVSKHGVGMMYQTFLLQKHWATSDTAVMLDYGDRLVYALSISPKILGGSKLKLSQQRL